MGVEKVDRPRVYHCVLEHHSCPSLPNFVVLGSWGCASRPGIPVTCLCLIRRYMKHKRDDGPEKQEDEAVDVTPVMTCVFVVMCCSMLVLLYYFYDHLGAALLEKCSRWRVKGASWAGPVPSLYWLHHLVCVHEYMEPFPGVCGGPRQPSPHHPSAHSLRDHRDLLPGLLHGPLQLPFTLGPEAAIWQMQVSPCGLPSPGPAQPLAHGSAC